MAKRLTDEQLKDVRMVLKDLLKVIKVVSMYPENNPLPQSLRRTFAERLIHIILDTGPLEINVLQIELRLGDVTVFTDQSREERLAGLFFATGITQLTFGESLDETGVYKLLDTIKAHQNSGRGESDLAAMLWEAQITGFSFRTIEDVALQDYDGDFKVQEVFQAGRRAGDDLSEEEKTGRWKALFDQKGSQRDPDDSGIFLVDDDHDSGQGDHFEDGGEIVLDSASQGIDISQIQPGPHHQQPAGGTPEHSGQPGQPGQPGPHGPSGSVRQPGQHGSGGAVGSMGTIQGTVFSGGDDASDIDLGVNEAVEAMGFADLSNAAPRLPDTNLILNDELRLSEEEEEQVQKLLVEDASFSVYESTAEILKEMIHQEVDLVGFSESVTICEKTINEFIGNGKITYATDVLRYFRQIEEQILGEKPQWASRLHEVLVTAGSRERLSHLANTLNANEEIGTVEIRGYLDLFGWQALMGVSEMLGQLHHELHRSAVSDYLALKGQGNIAMVARGIEDKRTEVVVASINVLAQIGDDQALGYLKKLLTHEDVGVRRVLVERLADCASDSAIHLLKHLATDSDAGIRRGAVKSLVARRGVAAFDALSDLVTGENFDNLAEEDQQAMLTAYSVLGGDMAVEYLLELGTKRSLFGGAEESRMQAMAFEALSYNRGQRCEKALVKLSSSWRSRIKELATGALKERRRRMYGGDDESSE